MWTLRFHDYGEPADVLRFEQAESPEPRAGHIRVRVQACGLNPADWALCRGRLRRSRWFIALNVASLGVRAEAFQRIRS